MPNCHEPVDHCAGPDHDAPEVLDAGMHLRYVGEQWQELYDLSGRFNSLYPLRLEGWINNAFDQHYYPVAFPFSGSPGAAGYVGETGEPLTMGITLGLDF